MKIIEKILTKAEVIESAQGELPKGVLCRALYPICLVDVKNHNGRKYSSDVWEAVHKNGDIKQKLDTRTLFGHAEHPQETTQSNLEKTSHIVSEMFMEKGEHEGKEVMVEKAWFDILDTPYGRLIHTLLEAGCQVGVSTRAEGDLEEADDGDGQYMRVIPESYDFKTVDFTADPSTLNAYPEKVEKTLVKQIKRGVESKKMDNSFAVSMLENCSTKEAAMLLESIKKEVNKINEAKFNSPNLNTKVEYTHEDGNTEAGKVTNVREDGYVEVTFNDGDVEEFGPEEVAAKIEWEGKEIKEGFTQKHKVGDYVKHKGGEGEVVSVEGNEDDGFRLKLSDDSWCFDHECKVDEGKKTPGKRDGTGPAKGSYQDKTKKKGKRKEAGEECPNEDVEESIEKYIDDNLGENVAQYMPSSTKEILDEVGDLKLIKETLSDGSEVFNIKLGNKVYRADNEKDAEKKFNDLAALLKTFESVERKGKSVKEDIEKGMKVEDADSGKVGTVSQSKGFMHQVKFEDGEEKWLPTNKLHRKEPARKPYRASESGEEEFPEPKSEIEHATGVKKFKKRISAKDWDKGDNKYDSPYVVIHKEAYHDVYEEKEDSTKGSAGRKWWDTYREFYQQQRDQGASESEADERAERYADRIQNEVKEKEYTIDDYTEMVKKMYSEGERNWPSDFLVGEEGDEIVIFTNDEKEIDRIKKDRLEKEWGDLLGENKLKEQVDLMDEGAAVEMIVQIRDYFGKESEIKEIEYDSDGFWKVEFVDGDTEEYLISDLEDFAFELGEKKLKEGSRVYKEKLEDMAGIMFEKPFDELSGNDKADVVKRVKSAVESKVKETDQTVDAKDLPEESLEAYFWTKELPWLKSLAGHDFFKGRQAEVLQQVIKRKELGESKISEVEKFVALSKTKGVSKPVSEKKLVLKGKINEEFSDLVSHLQKAIQSKLTKDQVAVLAQAKQKLLLQEAGTRAENTKLKEIISEEHQSLEKSNKSIANFRRLAGSLDERLDEERKRIKTLQKSVVGAEKKQKSVKEKLEKDFAQKKQELEEDYKQRWINKYAEIKASSSGLTLPEKVKALFAQCISESEVDKLMEEVREAMIDGYYHSGSINEVNVASEKDPKAAALSKRIRKTLGYMQGIKE